MEWDYGLHFLVCMWPHAHAHTHAYMNALSYTQADQQEGILPRLLVDTTRRNVEQRVCSAVQLRFGSLHDRFSVALISSDSAKDPQRSCLSYLSCRCVKRKLPSRPVKFISATSGDVIQKDWIRLSFVSGNEKLLCPLWVALSPSLLMFMDKHAEYHHNSGVCPLIACIVLCVFLRWPFAHNDSVYHPNTYHYQGNCRQTHYNLTWILTSWVKRVKGLPKGFAPTGFTSTDLSFTSLCSLHLWWTDESMKKSLVRVTQNKGLHICNTCVVTWVSLHYITLKLS